MKYQEMVKLNLDSAHKWKAADRAWQAQKVHTLKHHAKPKPKPVNDDVYTGPVWVPANKGYTLQKVHTSWPVTEKVVEVDVYTFPKATSIITITPKPVCVHNQEYPTAPIVYNPDSPVLPTPAPQGVYTWDFGKKAWKGTGRKGVHKEARPQVAHKYDAPIPPTLRWSMFGVDEEAWIRVRSKVSTMKNVYAILGMDALRDAAIKSKRENKMCTQIRFGIKVPKGRCAHNLFPMPPKPIPMDRRPECDRIQRGVHKSKKAHKREKSKWTMKELRSYWRNGLRMNLDVYTKETDKVWPRLQEKDCEHIIATSWSIAKNLSRAHNDVTRAAFGIVEQCYSELCTQIIELYTTVNPTGKKMGPKSITRLIKKAGYNVYKPVREELDRQAKSWVYGTRVHFSLDKVSRSSIVVGEGRLLGSRVYANVGTFDKPKKGKLLEAGKGNGSEYHPNGVMCTHWTERGFVVGEVLKRTQRQVDSRKKAFVGLNPENFRNGSKDCARNPLQIILAAEKCAHIWDNWNRVALYLTDAEMNVCTKIVHNSPKPDDIFAGLTNREEKMWKVDASRKLRNVYAKIAPPKNTWDTATKG